jgi:hypothetical protein
LSFFSSLFIVITSGTLGHCDLDQSGPCPFSLVLATTSNPFHHDPDICGFHPFSFGCSCWRSTWLWSWLQLPVIFLILLNPKPPLSFALVI